MRRHILVLMVTPFLLLAGFACSTVSQSDSQQEETVDAISQAKKQTSHTVKTAKSNAVEKTAVQTAKQKAMRTVKTSQDQISAQTEVDAEKLQARHSTEAAKDVVLAEALKKATAETKEVSAK